MSRRKVRIVKMILGAYLMIIGILLSIDVYAQKPSNMQFVFAIASILIIVGFLYLIQDIRKAIEKAMLEKAERNKRVQEEERIRRHQELHSSDKFRTAPMPVVKPVKLENVEEDLEEFDEKNIIITNYEEDKTVETKTIFKEMRVVEEMKKSDKADDIKKTENTHGLANDITNDKITDVKNEVEELAINIEERAETKEAAQGDKEEN